CFACSVPISFLWFFVWRFLSGWGGGIIMVLAPSAVLSHVPHTKRGMAGGGLFAGIGLGIAASGTLVPLLLRQGLRESWYGLGALSALLTLISWMNWPKDAGKGAAVSHGTKHAEPSGMVRALSLQYGLNAVALVPHMVFFVD